MTREKYEREQSRFTVDMMLAAKDPKTVDLIAAAALDATLHRYGPYLNGVAPESYRCGACGIHGVKLWRGHSGGPVRTSHGDRELACALCLRDRDGKPSVVDDDGKVACRFINNFKTDQVCDGMPAVPTEDLSTFWGYSSTPQSAVAWWKSLPTYRRPTYRRSEGAS